MLATVSGVVLWSDGTDHGTWATIHTDSVIALGGIVLIHLAVYLRKALRASARSLTATAVNRPEKVIIWALVAALVAGAIATGLEPTWHPSGSRRHRREPALVATPVCVTGADVPTTSKTSHIAA